jgi:hypothetical protein
MASCRSQHHRGGVWQYQKCPENSQGRMLYVLESGRGEAAMSTTQVLILNLDEDSTTSTVQAPRSRGYTCWHSDALHKGSLKAYLESLLAEVLATVSTAATSTETSPVIDAESSACRVLKIRRPKRRKAPFIWAEHLPLRPTAQI